MISLSAKNLKRLSLLLAALSSRVVFAGSCGPELFPDEWGEVFLEQESDWRYSQIHVTGQSQFPLALVAESLSLDLEKRFDGQSILSVGEGFSELVPHLNARGARAIGIDLWYHADRIPESSVGTAMRQYVANNRRTLVSADARGLPFRAGQFDVLVSSFLLHHLHEQDHPYEVRDDNASVRFFREVGRVLRAGGTAMITRFGHLSEEREALDETIALALGDAFESSVEQKITHARDLRTGGDLEVSVILVTLTKKR